MAFTKLIIWSSLIYSIASRKMNIKVNLLEIEPGTYKHCLLASLYSGMEKLQLMISSVVVFTVFYQISVWSANSWGLYLHSEKK